MHLSDQVKINTEPTCDRCNAGNESGSLSVFTECSTCGPVLLCLDCIRFHLAEINRLGMSDTHSMNRAERTN